MLLFPTAAQPEDIPDMAPGGQAWAGCAPYLTGYPWPASQRRRLAPVLFFINQSASRPVQARLVRNARCCDVQPDAFTVQEALTYREQRLDDGLDTIMYCDHDTFDQLLAAKPDLFTPPAQKYLTTKLFAAEWTGVAHQAVWSGVAAAATQYEQFPDYEACLLSEWL
jgi:hypothetical protein